MSIEMSVAAKAVAIPENTEVETPKEEDDRSEYSESMKEFVIKAAGSENFLLLLGLIAIAIDPLFFYIPEMKNNTSCLGLDKKLRIAAVTLRTCVDILHDVSWWHKSCNDHSPERWETIDKEPISFVGRIRLLWKWIKSCKIISHEGRPSLPARAIAVLAVIPFPQVVIFAVDLQSHLKAWLKYGLLIQLIPRIFRTYPTYLAVTTSSDKYEWIGAAFNLVFYVFASHLLGSFWYLRSIERKMDCWKGACRANSKCSESSLYCGNNNSINNGLIYDICVAQPTSNATTPFNYGMYKGAIESNLIGTPNFINKLSQSFWWGLHNLSSMAQDLESSDYIWDTVFAIFICIVGLLLFALLIGNLQIYIQSKMPTTLEKLKEKRKELKVWKPFYELPHDIRREVSMCRNYKWREANGVNLETLLTNTPKELKKEMRRHFCKNLFSKVEEFGNLPESVKKELRDRAKARVFHEKTIIIQEGSPIYEVVHIVDGKVLTYKKELTAILQAKHLKGNECFGEEVLQSAFNSFTPTLAIATKTFQSVTKVEVFTLSFDDIVAVFTKYGWLFPAYKDKWATSVFEGARQKVNRARNNQDKSSEEKDQKPGWTKVSKMMKGNPDPNLMCENNDIYKNV